MDKSKYYYIIDEKSGGIIEVGSGVDIDGEPYYHEEMHFCKHCGKPITVKDICISEEQLVNEVGRDKDGKFDILHMTPLYILSKHNINAVDIICEECWKDFIKCDACKEMYHNSQSNDLVLNGSRYKVCNRCVSRLFSPYGEEDY